MKTTNPKTPYAYGLEDGMAAFADSGSTADPINGWDGDLINALGQSGVCRLFDCSGGGEDWETALNEYVAGCREGVRNASSEDANK